MEEAAKNTARIKIGVEAWRPWRQIFDLCSDALRKIGPYGEEPSFEVPEGLELAEAIDALKNQIRDFCDRHQERAADWLTQLYTSQVLKPLVHDEKWIAHQMLLGIQDFVLLHQLDDRAQPVGLTTIFPVPEIGAMKTFQWLVETWWPHRGRQMAIEELAKDSMLARL